MPCGKNTHIARYLLMTYFFLCEIAIILFIVQTPCFTNCTACSAPVVAAFKAGCYEFIRDVCADSSILEHISGISALKEGISDELLASMEMDSEDEMIMDQDNGDDA